MLFSHSLRAHFDLTFGFNSIALSTPLSMSLRLQLRIHFQMRFDVTFEFTSILLSNSLRVHFDVTLAFTSTVWRKHQVLYYCTVIACGFGIADLWRCWEVEHHTNAYCTVLYCTVLNCTVRAYMMYCTVCPMWSNAIFLLRFREQATMDGDCVQMKQPQQYSYDVEAGHCYFVYFHILGWEPNIS